MTNTAIRYTPEFKQTLIDLHEKGHSFKELHEESFLRHYSQMGSGGHCHCH